MLFILFNSGGKNWEEQGLHRTERRSDYSDLVGKPEGPDRLEYLSVDGRIILKCTVKEQDLRS